MPMYAACMPGSWTGQQIPPGVSMPGISTPGSGMPGSVYEPPPRPRQAASHRQMTRRQGQRMRAEEFRIPSLWKRVVAEIIDFFLMFIIKFAVTVLIVEYLGIIDLEKHDFTRLLQNDIDLNVAWTMTTELVAMEVINRVFITFSETMCLRQGLGNSVGGSTPGKGIMGLKVILCDDIVDLPGNKVRIIPATDIGFCNALIRSTIKNFSLTFFFPVCFTVFFFQHNRAAYDIIANTIVVDASDDEIWPAR
ncbi:Protein FAM8A1 [Lamellibrachia satsuma]|nr:Protein FAM8A1 [Lamellibrachia satsuma]